MKISKLYATTILLKLLVLLLLFFLCRIVFFLFHFTYYSPDGPGNIFLAFLHGFRFDFAAIFAFNSLYFILFLLPIPRWKYPGFKKFLSLLFWTLNFTLLILNFIDVAYFTYTFKRSTADIFRLIFLSNDVLIMIPSYIVDYWYLFPILFLVFWFIRKLNTFFDKYFIPNEKEAYLADKNLVMNIAFSAFSILVLATISVIAIRGGTQLKPITINNASEFTPPRFNALVLNTPFTIAYTIGKPGLSEITWFAEKKATEIFNPIQNASDSSDSVNFIPYNIVIIVVESLSKEYVGAMNPARSNPSFTPFLDSLIGESLVFENAFANGKRSIDAIPAILSSMPSLMEEAYITSIYSGNQINSFASLLKSKGYTSAFYHGGSDGTMGFKGFVKNAGFEDYYGRNQYNNDDDYDGHWGIYDDKFLNYFAQGLKETPTPFVAGVFTLSSHPPFLIPQEFQSKFPKGDLEILQSMRYTDYSIQQFFNSVSNESWFDSTLFIITADHTSISNSPYYLNNVGGMSIPIIFYQHNSNLKGKNKKVMQQTDILPTVMNYIGFTEPFVAFGNNKFEANGKAFSVNRVNNVYQIIDSSHVLTFDGEKSLSYYNYKKDSLLQNNLLNKNAPQHLPLENMLKSVIQQYNNRILKNETVIGNR